jgi:hypothetical protein
MFGYFRFKKAVAHALDYFLPLFAPAQVRGTLPNSAFGDAYVLGFLQVVSVHAAKESLGSHFKTSLLIPIFETAMNSLVPGFGKQFIQSLLEVNEPNHPHHTNYMVGKRAATDYLEALRMDDSNGMQLQMQSFTNFLKRNYVVPKM